MIKKIEFYNFKNIENQVLDVGFDNVYFYGENAQGKTNLLDSIYCLAFASSFLVNSDKELIKYGKSNFYLKCLYETESKNGEISLSFLNSQKEIKVNETIIKDRKDLILNIPTIVFSNLDTEFIVGVPFKKRWFFDQAISLVSLSYIDTLRKYRKVLKQRNAVLKNGDKNLLKVYNNIFAKLAIEIIKTRKEFIDHFYEYFIHYYFFIFNRSENLELKYIPSVKAYSEEEFLDYLNEKEMIELKDKTSLVGPHKDNYEIIYSNRIFKNISSTGENRALALIYRLSQVIIFYKRFNIAPILLFDDVFLELDSTKRKKFFEILPNSSQCFFTFLDDYSRISRKGSSVFYMVQNGNCKLEKSE